MQYVSNGLSTIVCGIFAFSPIIGGLLFGAFWQVVVLLGLHAAFIPVLMNNLFSQGSDPINAVLGLTVWALAGVTFGYAIRNKDPEKRSAGFGSMASALCGVTEPAIYSVAVPNMKLFACAWVGGGISGAILGGLGGKNVYNGRRWTVPNSSNDQSGWSGRQLLWIYRLCSVGICSIGSTGIYCRRKIWESKVR